MRIPLEITLKYSGHAVREWSDPKGFIKKPPLKFFRFYNKHIRQDEETIKAIFPFLQNKKLNLILIIDIESGTVITNYLKLRNRD